MRVFLETFLGTFYGNKGYLWSLLEEHSVDKQPNISLLKEHVQKIYTKKGLKMCTLKLSVAAFIISAVIYPLFSLS